MAADLGAVRVVQPVVGLHPLGVAGVMSSAAQLLADAYEGSSYAVLLETADQGRAAAARAHGAPHPGRALERRPDR